MRFLILDVYYASFLDQFMADASEIHDYDQLLGSLIATGFGTSDVYSHELRRQGHEATEIIVNARPLQLAWASAHAPALAREYKQMPPFAWEQAIVAEQVRRSQPDILYVQDITRYSATFLERLRPFVRAIVGQVASPVQWSRDLRSYDLILSSFPHYVRRLRASGVKAHYLPLAFDPRNLERNVSGVRDLDAVFVGGISSVHASGNDILERVAETVRLDTWGYGFDALHHSSPLRMRHHGPAWGHEMYKILGRARVVVNRHADAAAGYANNMRMYEATGMGACLVTDNDLGLETLFRVGKEVVTYSSPQECAESVRYLLAHEDHREAIARAGQRRTLSEHTYERRMAVALQHISETFAGPPVWARATASSHLGLRVRSRIRREHRTGRRGYRRSPPRGVRAAATAVATSDERVPTLLHVGCRSGTWGEFLTHLLGGEVSYIGLDSSPQMVALWLSEYPFTPFVQGSTGTLPFREGSFDVVLFSYGLGPGIAAAAAQLAEAARVARERVVVLGPRWRPGRPARSRIEGLAEPLGLRVLPAYRDLAGGVMGSGATAPVVLMRQARRPAGDQVSGFE